MIAARRPRNAIGWLLLAASVGQAATIAGREYAVYALAVHGGRVSGGVWGAWTGSWGYAVTGLLSLAILLFPTGRLKSWRWLLPAVMSVVSTTTLVLSSALWPGPVLGGPGALNQANPLGWPELVTVLGGIGTRNIELFVTASTALSIASLLARLPAADRDLRRQISVIVIPAAVLSTESVWETWTYTSAQTVIAPIALTVFACAVAAALLRYGLYQVDRVVNLAIVYSAASSVLLGAYIAVVAISDSIIGHRTLGGSLVGTAFVALLFAPLRARLQQAGDRALYGARRDPYKVMSSLSEQLPVPGAALPALAETVARTLKLPYVAIEVDETETCASFGDAPRGEPLVIDLAFQGTPVGRLVLGRRVPTGSFHRDERQLFDDVARQVAVTAYALSLTGDLQRSRERLVVAREEERRRIRRDLHDGLGPTLAGIALQLDAARAHLHGDVGAADQLLGALVTQTQASLADIRRLVDDLRPPALDELGLASALREHATRFPGMHVSVVAPHTIDGLPAAVEVAAYRIATEALTNAARHADARSCTVQLSLNGALHLDIVDDGHGLRQDWQAGTGVASIRERAAELGGTCSLLTGPTGGTVVSARLPVLPS